MLPPEKDHKTHFGFESVSFAEKTKKVSDVFNSVAKRYDVMNDLMSFGIHRLWKQVALELASIRPHHYVLDLAAGTGDLSIKMAPLLNREGKLFVTDINETMLNIAKKRMVAKGLINHVCFLQVNAENIPFASNSFNCTTIAFGLRNVAHKQTALESIYRVLKPGGKLIILEFSHPTFSILNSLYDLYSFNILPKLGKFIANDEKSYRYLAESIRMHPDQEALCNMMSAVGFENCTFQNFTGGIVAIHRGYKFA